MSKIFFCHLIKYIFQKRSAEWIADISLRRAWEPAIGPDKVASLISRVATSVVEVRPEENVHVVELL